MLHRGRPVVGYGFVAVDVVERVVAEVGVRLKPLRPLIADEIEQARGSEDEGAPTRAGIADGSLAVALPSEDGDVFLRTTEDNLIPSHSSAALAVEIPDHAVHKAALQLFDVVDALPLHLLLTEGTSPPVRLLCLVAAQVDILRGEDVHHLVEDVLQEAVHTLVASAIDDAGILATDAWQHTDEAVAHHGAGHLGISSNGCHAVGRHLYLGDDVDMPLLGIRHDVAQVALGVEATDGCRLALAWILTILEVGVALHAPCSHRGESRILLDLYAPSVVVGEVQVQVVHLEARGDVDDLQDMLFRNEVAHHVEHQSAIGEARCIVDGETAQPLAVRLLQQLPERLFAVEESLLGRGRYGDATGRNGQPVGLFCERAVSAVLGLLCLPSIRQEVEPFFEAEGRRLGEKRGVRGWIAQRASEREGYEE